MATRVSVQGNVIEVTVMDGVNRVCRAVKLDADHWADTQTGEVHEYEHGATRADSVASLRRTFRRIRALVNCNCSDVSRVRWITLTYAENMSDTKRLYKDFGSFWKRFKRRWGSSDYIIVVEPQARGAWHVHMLALWDGRAPYVPNDELRECWGQGFVKVTALDSVDNVGAYLCAYLGDVEIPDGKDAEVMQEYVLGANRDTCINGIKEKVQQDGSKKRFLKGGRLGMYPVGMQIYRHSRGIIEPEECWIEGPEDYAWADSILQGAAVVYVKEHEITDESGQVHRVRYTQYNRVRGNKEVKTDD